MICGGALVAMVCWGLFLVVVQIKPFWVDEWRIIYNLKYKDAAALWGPLDFMQQFPRVYLLLIKAFTSLFHYSYFALRFPSFVVGACAIMLAHRLAGKLFAGKLAARLLFPLIIIASPVFFGYFVQVKQYTMDILLALLALWQLLQMQDLLTGKAVTRTRYVLLCATFAVAPFFSYTYPIVVAPVFGIVFLRCLMNHWLIQDVRALLRVQLRVSLPVLIGAVAILVFYRIDALQLMLDNKMQLYWSYLTMNHGFNVQQFGAGLYHLFALAGSGLGFEIVYAAVGIPAFIAAMAKAVRIINRKVWSLSDYLNCYCAGLMGLVLVMFVMGKIPIGEARLTAFALPATALLLISAVEQLSALRLHPRLAAIVPVLLFIGTLGPVVTSPLNELCDQSHVKALSIYVNTENAILLADLKGVPIFITSGVAYPCQEIVNYPCTDIAATALCIPPRYVNTGCSGICGKIPGDWVLKTFPAYNSDGGTAVYALNDMSELKECMKHLPATIKSVIAGDGSTFREVLR